MVTVALVEVKRAADLYAQGRTLRQIGAELGVPWTAVGHQLRRAYFIADGAVNERTPAPDVSLISGRPVDHGPTALPTTRR